MCRMNEALLTDKLRLLTSEDVAIHNTEGDCYIIVGNLVRVVRTAEMSLR